MKTEVNMLLI